jgi:hypothetical protein|tara:strand:- start:3648 stop:4793 length:1146 start_codon:yes stop_codon:yes gene_type:complete
MKNKKWSKKDVAFLKKNYPFFTNSELAEELFRTVNAIEKKASKLKLYKNLSENLEGDRNLLRARTEGNITKKKYKEALLENDRLRVEKEAILRIQETPQKIKFTQRQNGGSDATAFIIASDWHIEETVRPSDVSGLNEYNLEICDKRVKKFFSNAVKLLEITQKESRVNQVVLALLGDFISGHIHLELLENNTLLPADAIWRVQNYLISGINFLLNNSKIELTIICHGGNHGRMTKRIHHATEQGNSLEVYMYNNIALHFKNNKRINFVIAEGYHTYVDVYDYKVRLHHGHAIRYAGGVGGIFIPVNKAIAQWNKGRTVDLDVFGHFHQFKDGGNFICNGSLIGYNAFALSIKADYEKPKQAFFLVDKKRGKSIVAPIWLQ